MGQKKVKKVQMNFNPGQAINLYGIVSSEPDYKISMEINKALNISLKSVTPALVKQGNAEETAFARFSDISDLPDSWISIIRNRSNNYYLFRKFPNFDYIAAVYTESENFSAEGFAAKLRSVKHISAVFLTDKKNIEPEVLETIIPH
jgi:hypothetical protein